MIKLINNDSHSVLSIVPLNFTLIRSKNAYSTLFVSYMLFNSHSIPAFQKSNCSLVEYSSEYPNGNVLLSNKELQALIPVVINTLYDIHHHTINN